MDEAIKTIVGIQRQIREESLSGNSIESQLANILLSHADNSESSHSSNSNSNNEILNIESKNTAQNERELQHKEDEDRITVNKRRIQPSTMGNPLKADPAMLPQNIQIKAQTAGQKLSRATL
jgi:hypothetical protein